MALALAAAVFATVTVLNYRGACSYALCELIVSGCFGVLLFGLATVGEGRSTLAALFVGALWR